MKEIKLNMSARVLDYWSNGVMKNNRQFDKVING
jgi:hypothetical protein